MTISIFMILTLLVQTAALIALLVIGKSLAKDVLSIADTEVLVDELRLREDVELREVTEEEAEKLRQALDHSAPSDEASSNNKK